MKNAVILEAIDWLLKMDRRLPAIWPEELPPEDSPGFWTLAMQAEMRHRATVSKKTALLIAGGGEPPPMTDLECWLYRRRGEWAGQVLLVKAEQGVPIPVPLRELLEWALIRSYDSDGCIAFWNHAIERGGVPHPDNPDGFSPLG